ncbi:putative quinol monooxygenase [Streptomyces sp. NPDC085946]|uniref:putative quinol monooxygenase n=1 Tax=Streptomyces sp. NPDC085946 TaxID=3365744 RepID=UPI0037CF2124
MTEHIPEAPVVLIARMRARAGRGRDLRAALAPLVNATRQEPGCLTYVPHQGQDDPDLVVMHEIWQSEAHLRAHEHSPHLREFARLATELTEGGIAIERLRRLDRLG